MNVIEMNRQITAAVAIGSWQEVLALTDAALAADPRSLKALESRALALASLERHAEALTAYETVIAMFQERAQRGLDVEKPLAVALVHKGYVSARMGDSETALLDVAHAQRLDPTTHRRVQSDPAWKELLKASRTRTKLPGVRRQGILLEISSPPGPGRRAELGRSDLYVLGTAAEIMDVLRVEIRHVHPTFIGDPTRPTMTAWSVSRGKLAEPIDLRSFLEVECAGHWRSLDDAKDQFLDTAAAPNVRIVEEKVRAAFPSKKACLLAGDVLHLAQPFASQQGYETESEQLEHGAYELGVGEHWPLGVALGERRTDAAR